MCSMNILEGITGSEEETVYELTTNGKALMTALSAIKNLTDETIKKIVNGSIRVIDFVKEHDSEIIGFIKFAIMR